MTCVEVITTAAGSSVQDGGRFGCRRLGVSTAGAMDRWALARANALVGNAATAAAIEFPFFGGRYRVSGGPILVAVAGPGISMNIAGRRIESDRSALARHGEEVSISPVRGGVYGYLAIGGGILTEPDLGSRSTHLRSGIGGDPIKAGDRLPCLPQEIGAQERQLIMPEQAETGPIRAVLGPQADHFADETKKAFLSQPFTVDPHSDRMGITLNGPGLAHVGDFNIVSDGIVPGSVQVPGSGQPIIMMRDCQTTGGYPKIATVISADLDQVAQAEPGSTLRFTAVSVEEASKAARVFAAFLDAIRDVAHPAGAPDDSAYFLSRNLIGGVVSGGES